MLKTISSTAYHALMPQPGLLTKATSKKLEALAEGESYVYTSGPGQTTTATRLPNGDLEHRLNPTPERPGLNFDQLFGFGIDLQA